MIYTDGYGNIYEKENSLFAGISGKRSWKKNDA